MTELNQAFQSQLIASPAAAVETQLLLDLYSQDPGFYRSWPVAQRWRLLYGLDHALLDFGSVLDLSEELLCLPDGIGSINLRQVCRSLYCDDFILAEFGWNDELELSPPLSAAQCQACDDCLFRQDTMARVDALIAKALEFAASSDEYLLDTQNMRPQLFSRLRGALTTLLQPKSHNV